jgi:thiamine-monophosphate kinase
MIDELSALRLIKERFQRVSKNILVGIGDDAAAVKLNPENLLLATVDSQIEGVHFVKGFTSTKELGRKAIAVSVSDIGAMGGVPKFFLASLGFSEEEDEAFFEELMDGIQEAAEEFKIDLIGGNLSESKKFFLDVTVLGEVEPNLLIKRSGARTGDKIFVSGTVGDSALGLKILTSETKSKMNRFLISRHNSPEPRLKLSRELAQRGLVTSMIDLSDGLILDLERITAEYGLGAEVSIDKIPMSYHYKENIYNFTKDLYELALSGGEDYELIFTSPKEKREEITRVSRKLNIQITEIGRVTNKPPVRVLDGDGKEIKLKGKGFIHFNI